jgi:RimJ/RimL family protein N-acetyltransferase
MSETIQTERLRLTPVAAGDVDELCALLHQPDVRRYLFDGEIVSRDTVAGWIAESRDPASGTSLWRIAAEDETCAGLAGLRPPSVASLRLRAIGWRSREIVIALDPGHWGRGLACEVVEALALHAGADGVTFALVAGVDAPNERSHRLMQRTGFGELGRVPGPAHTLVVYERAV